MLTLGYVITALLALALLIAALVHLLSPRRRKLSQYPNAVPYLERKAQEFAHSVFQQLPNSPPSGEDEYEYVTRPETARLRWSLIPGHKLASIETALRTGQPVEIQFRTGGDEIHIGRETHWQGYAERWESRDLVYRNQTDSWAGSIDIRQHE